MLPIQRGYPRLNFMQARRDPSWYSTSSPYFVRVCESGFHTNSSPCIILVPAVEFGYISRNQAAYVSCKSHSLRHSSLDFLFFSARGTSPAQALRRWQLPVSSCIHRRSGEVFPSIGHEPSIGFVITSRNGATWCRPCFCCA